MLTPNVDYRTYCPISQYDPTCCCILALVMSMRLRIRDLREDADLTQRQVAEECMCDQSLYSKYERGERPLPLEEAIRLAHFYRTSLDYLVGLTDDPTPRS